FLVVDYAPGFTGDVTIEYRIADTDGAQDTGFATAHVDSSYSGTINGSILTDYVEGGALADIIRTGAGIDRIVALGGNDRVEAGAGDDLIDAGDGDD
ncbi:hypothetical protein LTR94_037018, partial [Friedmanniomyces endolithicus]